MPAGVITVTATDVPNVTEFVGETESSQEVEIRARVEGFLEAISYQLDLVAIGVRRPAETVAAAR